MNTLMSREKGLGGRAHASRARLGLAVAVAVVAMGCTGVASAMAASQVGASHGASEWAKAPASGGHPSLTNDVGVRADGNRTQLRLGLGLMGLGALALTFGLALMHRAPRAPTLGFGGREGIRRVPLRATGTSTRR